MTRRFGFECEVYRGAQAVLDILAGERLLPEARLHDYHCSCHDCTDIMDRTMPFHAQRDCTVDGEIISKALVYGSAEADTAFRGIASAILKARAQMTYDEGGFHVHVSHEGLTPTAKVRLYKLFLAYQADIGELASGALGNVRSYNRPLDVDRLMGSARYRGRQREVYNENTGRYEIVPPTPEGLDFWTSPPSRVAPFIAHPDKCNYLAHRAHTFEFRIWNAARAEWRMRMAVGVSVAMVEAAKAGVNITRPNPSKSMLAVLEPFMDADTIAGVIRQSTFMEGVA